MRCLSLIYLAGIWIVLLLGVACQQPEAVPIREVNSSTAIEKIVLKIGSQFVVGMIDEKDINFDLGVLFGSKAETSATIEEIVLSEGATSDKVKGSFLTIKTVDTIFVLAEDGFSKRTYVVRVHQGISVPKVITYTDTNVLGIAIEDTSLFNLNDTLIELYNVQPDITFSYEFGNNYGLFTSDNQGKIYILYEHFKYANARDGSSFIISLDKTTFSIARFSPYEIMAWQDVQAIRNRPNQYYEIKKDIQFPSAASDALDSIPSSYLFEPIDFFSGTLEGNNHIIEGVYIDQQQDSRVGIFKQITSEAYIQNIRFVHVLVAGRLLIGMLAGVNYGNIQNVYSDFSYLVAKKNDFGESGVGGFVGDNHGLIINSSCSRLHIYSTGTYTGGMAGLNRQSSIVIAQTEGRIHSDSDVVAGLVGYNLGQVKGFSNVTITGMDVLGGLVGVNSGGQVVGYHNRGSIVGNSYIGGLVGINFQGKISGTSFGTVQGNTYIGGLVGFCNGNDLVLGSSYSDVSGTSFVGGLIGYMSNQGSSLYGYFIGTIRRIKNSSSLTFGFLTGTEFSGTMLVEGLYSEEASVYEGVDIEEVMGQNGEGVGDIRLTTKSSFNSFNFSNHEGEFHWLEDGRWPTILFPTGDFFATIQQEIDTAN